MNSKFYFAKRCSKEFHITVEKCPEFEAAEREMETLYIPGRNGALTYSDGAFKNVSQKYEVWFKSENLGTTAFSKEIALWLLSPQGYQVLEDDYDPDIYRQAFFKGPLNIENWMLKRGRATLEFECKPQRFLKSGDLPRQILTPQTLYNSYMPSLPLIKVVGSGAGTVTIGGVTISITNISEFLILDSDTQNAYKGNQNQNNNIKLSNYEFPTLQSGENKISFSGGVESVEITPRWWTL